MTIHPRVSSASSRTVRLLAVAGALLVQLNGSMASAQGIYPGNLSKDGYKLPGGFEPVVQLRTYHF